MVAAEKKDGKKKDDVELVGGGKDGDATERKTTDGPTTGDDAPLFGKVPDLGSHFSFEGGELVVCFSRATDEAEWDRLEAEFFVALLAVNGRFMPAQRRGKADANGEDIDIGARLSIRRGKLVAKFPRSQSKPWRFETKNQVRKAVLELRAKLIGLPLIAA